MSTSDPWPEEPWEAQVHELLAGLPPVDPPEGFIARAIDHRPKYAGRLSVLAVSSVTIAAAGIVGLGLVGDRAVVAPPVPTLAARHVQVGAGVLGGGGTDEIPFERLDDTGEVVTLPSPFRLLAAVRDGELVQAVYDYHGEPVSVFAQPGTVSWDELPAEGIVDVGDRTVWVDDDRKIVVLEAGSDVVAVVGLDADAAIDLLGGEPADHVSLADRLRSLAAEVAGQAGFP